MPEKFSPLQTKALVASQSTVNIPSSKYAHTDPWTTCTCYDLAIVGSKLRRTCLSAGQGIYSKGLPRGPELPERGGLKGTESAFAVDLPLTAGPRGTYCRAGCKSSHSTQQTSFMSVHYTYCYMQLTAYFGASYELTGCAHTAKQVARALIRYQQTLLMSVHHT